VGRAECVPAQDLAIGDALVGHDGVEVTVEGVVPSGEWIAVYNLRVADYHTYFVGGEAWGFSVWAHNTGCGPEQLGFFGRLLNRILPSTQERFHQLAEQYLGVIRRGEVPSEALNTQLRDLLLRRLGEKDILHT